VVPLLVLIPALGSRRRTRWPPWLWPVKAAVLLGLLLTGGQRVMRWWLTLVARRKSEELFMLNLLLVTLGLAWLTELAGLSAGAGGLHVAGMLMAETEYKHQVETDIRPFHDVLLGLFFITIGMMLDWREVAENWLAWCWCCWPCLWSSSWCWIAALAWADGSHRRRGAAHRPVPGAGR
jgi:monovalent cation:H+ antiporter-2, CPA2 family